MNTPCTILSRPVIRVLLVALLLALVPLAAHARLPKVDMTATEVVSPRLVRHLGPTGQLVTSPDLAVEGQIMVQLWANATADQLNGALQRTGGVVLHAFRAPGMLLIGLPAGQTVKDAVRLWGAEAAVQLAEPDRIAYPTRIPNDPLYPTQYHPPLMNAPSGWDAETGSSSVVIAINDTGTDLGHEDLQSRLWDNSDETPGNGIDDDGNGFIDDRNGWDFIDNDNNPNPDLTNPSGAPDHGTHVAGIAAAATDNGVGVSGVDWSAEIMVIRVLGPLGGSFSQIAAGIDYAAANGATVINMSLGGSYSDVLTAPITAAWARGVSVVCAAGNDGATFTDDPNTWSSPVCNDGPGFGDNHVTGVAASDRNDVLAGFTNLDGSSREFVDVTAPGVDILSTLPFDPANGFNTRYGGKSGTSMACPVVAGIMGLIRAHFTAFTPDAALAQLRRGCVSIDTQNPTKVGLFGAGRVNVANVLGDIPPGPPRSVQAFDTPGDEGGSITVTWNLSVDDGRGANDVAGYKVFRSDDAQTTFVEIADLPRGSRTYVDTSVEDYKDYWYRVTVRDAINTTAAAVVGPVQARDDLAPPAITVIAVDTPNDRGGSIFLSWSDYSPPDDFAEYRVYRFDRSFSQTTEAGVTRIATITSRSTKSYQDRTVVDNKDYWYAVTAVDDAPTPNELTNVTAAGPVRANPNFAFSFGPGLTLFSLGVQPQETDLGLLFAGQGAGKEFARWDPILGQSGGYRRYSDDPTDPFLRQALGRGFWLQSTLAINMSISGALAARDQQPTFVPGWNQLGNPYDQDVSISDMRAIVAGTPFELPASNQQGYTADYFWTYDNLTSSYRLISESLPFSTSQLRRGSGFFFFANRLGQLLMPRPVAPAEARAAKPATAVPSEQEWALRLAAAVDGAADTDNFLGVSSQAARHNGVLSPPQARNGVDLYFPAQGARHATSFRGDLGGGAWDLAVAARARTAVRLSWPDLSQMPRGCRPVLRDLSTGQSVYLRTSSGYGFTLGAGETERRFALEISAQAGDLLAIRSLQVQPAATAVQITYTLSAPATATVEILNVAGRVIRRLAVTSQQGTATALWDRAGAGGSRAPAGTYVVRLTARGADGQSVTALRTLRLP